MRVVLEDLVDDGEERLELGLWPGSGSSVSGGLGVAQDLLERVPVDVELAADGTLALAVDQDATADLSPILHVGEHPDASQQGPVMKVETTLIVAECWKAKPWALRFLTDRRSPTRATFFDRRSQHLLMPGIIEFPKVVQDALAQYGDLFANECQRRHFAEYLTGLFVAERKTVLGIHSEFAETTDQSCLNRFLTEAEWDVEALNERRLEELQKDPSTRYSDQGVIPIDNTLIDRDGMLIPDAGWYWDHAEERNKIAQDYLFVNYVCTSGKHYPLEFRLFRKQEICEALKEPFRNHTACAVS